MLVTLRFQFSPNFKTELRMSFSNETLSGNDELDMKFHYQYHGNERCGLIDTKFSYLYRIGYDSVSYFKE